jgi:HD-GYP domain-containing protein (c-di-GMP phosphodiesterase class II)
LAEPARRRPRGRILFAILLLLFCVGTLPLVWTSVQLISDSRERLAVELNTLQQSKARNVSRQVAFYVRSLEAQVHTIASTLGIETRAPLSQRIAEIRDAQALRRYVDPDGPLPIYYMSVVDTTCTGAGSGVPLPEESIGQFMNEGCLRGRDGRSMISQPVIAHSVREPILVISAPVMRGATDVQGVVLAVASLRPVLTMTREMSEGGIEVYVVDSRGWLVAHPDTSRLVGDRDVSGVEIVKRFLAGQGQVSSTEPFTIPGPKGPLKMLGTTTRVPDDSGWGVIVQVSDETAYYSVYDARRRSLKLVGAVTALAVLLGMVFAGQISHPIHALARGARELASGNYAARVSVRSRNEVGILAEAFNQMGEEIQKAIEQIRRAAAVNKELFVGSIRMLANAIDEKDPYTRGHSDRVAYYARLIARHMGMPDDEVERVYLSGILHDVGKIGIEDKILRKAGALTDEEYEIMKQHPKKGEYILAAVPMLKDMTGDGLRHHENVDGSGYPDKLTGDQIPLLGRIVSVADAFDAMTTDRPYSKAWTYEKALARLRELAGKKFDESCVTAMEKAFSTGDLTPAKVHAAVAQRGLIGN